MGSGSDGHTALSHPESSRPATGRFNRGTWYDGGMDDEISYKSPNPPAIDPPDDGEVRRLTTVAAYFDPFHANLARSRLVDEGIPTFIQGAEFASMAWHLTIANRGIKVQVPAEHAEHALAILSDTSRAGTAQEHDRVESSQSNTAEADRVDDREAEAERQLTTREQNANRAFRGAVIGLLFQPLEFYVLWLLLKVLVSKECMSRRFRNRALVAVIISLPVVILLCLVLKSLFRN
jgi:hypothetical protein